MTKACNQAPKLQDSSSPDGYITQLDKFGNIQQVCYLRIFILTIYGLLNSCYDTLLIVSYIHL